MTKKNVSVKVDEGESPKLQLNKKDGAKILKGAGYAAGGAVAVYLLGLLPQIDFGELTIYVVPIASICLNAAVKFFKGK